MAETWEDLSLDAVEQAYDEHIVEQTCLFSERMQALDVHSSEKSDSKDTCSKSGSLWRPCENDEMVSKSSSLARWHIAYTGHEGIAAFGLPSLNSIGELARGPQGDAAQAVFASSFHPFEPYFLRCFPTGIPLTICVQGENNPVEHFFGLQVKNINCVEELGIHTGSSKFCMKCMPPGHRPMKCSTNLFVNPCQCPQQEINDIEWIFPKLRGRDIMHTKLMLFRFSGYVRLVISSFNLSSMQWSSAGDSFWWADLPLTRRRRRRRKTSGEPQVEMPVLDTLKRWGLEDTWVSLLAFCDWSSLQELKSRIQVLTSVPESISDPILYGMPRLCKILKSMPKFPLSADCPVYVQVWSLGGANDGWYSDFSRALTQESFSELGCLVDWKSDHVRLIFQRRGGGMDWRELAELTLEAENRARFHLNMAERPKQSIEIKKLMWDETESALLKPKTCARQVPWGWHSKIMTREYPAGFCKRTGCKRVHGWRYIGSHNCSRASWGWSSGNTPTSKWSPPRNWEMGVVITSLPVACENEECGIDLGEAAPLPFKKKSLARTFPWL